jgi:hypothetical protein
MQIKRCPEAFAAHPGATQVNPTNTNGYHPADAVHRTAAGSHCAFCGTQLQLAQSIATGACLACRIMAEAVVA